MIPAAKTQGRSSSPYCPQGWRLPARAPPGSRPSSCAVPFRRKTRASEQYRQEGRQPVWRLAGRRAAVSGAKRGDRYRHGAWKLLGRLKRYAIFIDNSRQSGKISETMCVGGQTSVGADRRVLRDRSSRGVRRSGLTAAAAWRRGLCTDSVRDANLCRSC
jgi:hypothetical protein